MSDSSVNIRDDADSGLPHDPDALLPIVYGELRRLAAHQLSQERAGHTLSPTALVHEAYLRLLGTPGAAPQWNSKGHFFSSAAQAMRRILVESARRRQTQKRGREFDRVEFDALQVAGETESPEILELDEALTRLEQHDRQLAQLVSLRYFAGLTMPQVAELLGVPLRTAERNWTYARAWLKQAILEQD